MVRVINNNLWTPVPWGFGCGGHQCSSNNWMNNMLKYQFMFGMMNNISNMFRCYVTPPQQQGDFYPGLYLGGGGGTMPQNYEEYLQQQQDTQSLTELKSAYSEFNIRKIGDRYFAYLKSDKTQRIEADSVDELMDGLNEYVDQNPDKFKAKPAKAETSRVDGEGDIERDDVADASEVDDGAAVSQAGNTPGNSPANNTERRVATRPYKKAELDQHHHWSTYNNLQEQYKTKFSTGMSVYEVLFQAIPAAKDWPADTRDQYIQYLRDANPNAIDNNDKVTDLSKLDLILEDSAPATTTPEVINKTKSRTLYITFAIHSLRGCYGDASVTTPDGVTHTVSTGVSWDNENARNDLGKKMVEKLKAAGWRNFTLKNSNFNFSITQCSGASGLW